jgi:iron complex outermembrane receptor protein
MRSVSVSTKATLKVHPRLLAAVSVVAICAAMNVPARAQDADGGVETATVTSTRVERDGYSAPTPVTSVSTKDIQQQAPSTVGDVLDNLPSFRPTSTPTTSGVNSLGGGQVTADLRGLGASRTLLLVNGKRFVPSATDGTSDLTQIPTLLVERVEVVTGGASAAYGSDAVTGVVNIILNNHFEGFKANVQYGESKYSDDIEEQGALAYGGSALGGRLRFTIGADYVNNEGIGGQYTRDWGRKEVGLITNPAFATNKLPNYIISPNDHTATMSNGGLIVSAKTTAGATSAALNGIAFGPGGVPQNFKFGQVFGSSMIGGEQAQPNPTLNSNLGKPFNALTGLGHVEYDLTPDIKAYLDVSGARTGAGGASQQPRDTGLVIKSDNAYLPSSIKTAMATDGLSSITLGRYYDDTGLVKLHSTNQTYRVIGGFEGKVFGDWNWDANYQYGKNTYFLNFGPNNRNQANFLQASDAVVNPATGAIVCRSTTAQAAGCIPVDVLGDGSETLNPYVNGSATYHLVNEQTVADIDLNGEPFSTWAGPVSVAAGLEYRREAARAIADPVSTQVNADNSTGGWALGNQKNFGGAFNVYDGYLETVVPLAGSDPVIPLLRNIDVNAAIRLTSYSTAGGVTTWKTGFNWQPIDDLRIRGTRSHDVRAPNISELFQGGTGSSYTSVFDKVLNQSVQIRQVGQGNTALKPEKAETWTGGFVYQPSWLDAFQLSVDYYNIRVAGVISSIGAPTLAAGCYAGNALYCQSVNFNPNGTINYIVSQSLNLNTLKTSGVDFESSYSIPANDLLADLDGTLSVHGLATYVNDLINVLPGNVVQNSVGQVSNFNRISGVPKWTGTADISYDFEPWSVNLRMHYVGAGVFGYSLTNGAGAANTIANNTVGDLVYFDVGGSYNFSVEGWPVQLYGTVDNLFDKDPPSVPSGAAGGANETSTNPVFYDSIGRLFKIGLRVTN